MITITTMFVLALTFLAIGYTPVHAGSKASPPQSSAFGKSLSEWMQLYMGWLLGGGDNHVGNVQFLALPAGQQMSGAFTYADPSTVVGHLDVSLSTGSPFALPVVVWFRERYTPETGYPDDPVLPADIFTDTANSLSSRSTSTPSQ